MTMQTMNHHQTMYMTTIHNQLADVQIVLAATDAARQQYLSTTTTTTESA